MFVALQHAIHQSLSAAQVPAHNFQLVLVASTVRIALTSSTSLHSLTSCLHLTVCRLRLNIAHAWPVW